VLTRNAGGSTRGMRLSSSGKFIAVLATALLCGCAWTPHDVHISSAQEIPTSNVGNGTKLFFRFIDDRDDISVGHRGVGSAGATITANDLPNSVETRLREILQKKGFVLVDSGSSSDPSVTYRLRSFKFEISQGLFTGTQAASAALEVEASKASQTFEHVYRANNEHDIFYVPDGGDLDGEMNGLLGKVLTQAATDTGLDNFLVGQ